MSISTQLPISYVEHDYSLMRDRVQETSSPEVERDLETLSQIISSGAVALFSQAKLPADEMAARAPITLDKPNSVNRSMPESTKAALIRVLTNARQGQDIDKIDRAVASVATLCGGQMQADVHNGKSVQRTRAQAETQNRASDPYPTGRALPAVEGGADITAPDRTGLIFSNVMGDEKMLDAFTSVIKAQNKQEANANALAAKNAKIVMASATFTGDKLIGAAEERRSGAIAAGITSLVGQGTASVFSFKGANKQIRAVNSDLSTATRTEKALQKSQHDINASKDVMMQKGQHMPSEVRAGMAASHPMMQSESSELRNRHSIKTQESIKLRTIAESLQQGSRVSHEVIDRGYESSSAAQSKEAEISRANQSVSGEVGNAHMQTVKKASEGESALRQTLQAILSNNNDAIAAQASRM